MRRLFALLCCSLFIAAPIAAQTPPDSDAMLISEHSAPKAIRIVEPIPNARTQRPKAFHRVVAAKTPSGFEVPRYVSLKFGKINGRSGPSMNHPVLWEYRRRGLPVIVVAETEQWRKVRDINGDEAWVYLSGLSGQRHIITIAAVDILKRPKAGAPLIAVAEKDALLRLEGCENAWCCVSSKGGLKGWTLRANLWGAKPLF